MRVRHVILPVLAAGLLTACATTGQQASVPPPVPDAKPATMYEPRITQNDAYVRKVETLARIRGVTVRWVNKPVKREVDAEQ